MKIENASIASIGHGLYDVNFEGVDFNYGGTRAVRVTFELQRDGGIEIQLVYVYDWAALVKMSKEFCDEAVEKIREHMSRLRPLKGIDSLQVIQ